MGRSEGKGVARRKKNRRREIAKGMVITKETAEIEAARERDRQKRLLLERGLVPCGVCGKRAKMVEFGLEGNGVWVGCDRSAECCRYIEIHTEGWSAEEAAAEWNRYNSGMFGVLRKWERGLREWGEKRREKKERRARKGKKGSFISRFLDRVKGKKAEKVDRTSTDKGKKRRGERR